jgi:hypothetical protein
MTQKKNNMEDTHQEIFLSPESHFTHQQLKILTRLIRKEVMAQTSQIAQDMADAIVNLQKQLGALQPTPDQLATQIHAVVDPQLTALNTALAAVQATEGTDETDIANLVTAVSEFTAAFKPPAAAIPPSVSSGAASS